MEVKTSRRSSLYSTKNNIIATENIDEIFLVDTDINMVYKLKSKVPNTAVSNTKFPGEKKYINRPVKIRLKTPNIDTENDFFIG